VFAGACRSPPRSDGEWNFTSSSRPWPSGLSIIAVLNPDALEPHHAVHPTALDGPVAHDGPATCGGPTSGSST
jgi:hypothetical protein